MKHILTAALKRQQQTMEVALIKDADNYTWYTATKTLPLERRGKEVNLKAGEVVGLRLASNGKQYRLITKSLGETIIFTIDSADYAFLLKRLTPLKTSVLKKNLISEDKAAGKEKALQKKVQDQIDNNVATWLKIEKVLSAARAPTKLDIGFHDWLVSVAKAFRTAGARFDDDFDYFSGIEDAVALKNTTAAIQTLAKAVFDKPASKIVKTKNDTKALGISSLILRTSVRSLYAGGLNLIDNGSLSLAGVYFKDAADHMKAAILISQYDGSRKSVEAIEKATRLDSSSRDEFDDRAWDWIQDYAR